MSIKTADIEFNAHGTPFATDFDDVYFSNAQGVEETRYVFLANNQLPKRWENWQKPQFVIAETGFGTGLNFLVTLQAFAQFCQRSANNDLSLHFISTEKHPLHSTDLRQALLQFSEFNSYSDDLIRQYPLPLSGCHRLTFLHGKVTLDLWLGDIHDTLPQLYAPKEGLVDAWFLDGFSPSKNPQMWSQPLFKQMVRLAAPHCTFATFTAAGFVKRDLCTAGFTVQKRPGHGLKRDMLAGHIEDTQQYKKQAGYFHRQGEQPSKGSASSSPQGSVAIIGGGLAGANCAYALAKRGYQVKIYCQESALSQGASGNPQGGFYPQLNAEANIFSQINALSFFYGAKIYRELLHAGHNFAHQWCGVLQVAFNSKAEARFAKLVENNVWPEALIHPVTPVQATKLSQLDLPYSGLFMPLGGWINPPELVTALIAAAAKLSPCEVRTDKQLTSLTRNDQKWQLQWQDGTQSLADIVVLATGAQSTDLSPLADFPLRLVRGQVEAIAAQEPLQGLSTVLCHKGYLTPDYQGHHALGSSYVKGDTSCEYRLDEQTTNLNMLRQALEKCEWPKDIQGSAKGRAATRCGSPDHLPLVGAIANIEAQNSQYADLYKALPLPHYPQAQNLPNLFMLNGLGSRGLTTAPLMAELLASQIANQPLPLGNTLLNALNPNRFLVQELIRRQP
ncbi:MAG: tRNA 5-methylaminomethyl-2-thiouridine biosynthesis bifunctional protein [Paraglaciecola sp.]